MVQTDHGTPLSLTVTAAVRRVSGWSIGTFGLGTMPQNRDVLGQRLTYALVVGKQDGDMRGEQTIEISATPERVYGVISDLTRMGEFSPECHSVQWLDGATGPARGSRFVGHNRGGPVSWSREGRIVAAEPGQEFSFVTEWRGHDSTLWTYRLVPIAGGTSLTESYEAHWAPWWMHVLDAVTFRRRQLAQHMSRTLTRLKRNIESLPSPQGEATADG